MTIQVFIADDHTVVRQGLKHLLELEPDLRVAGTAGDGREAVSLMLRQPPDVAIMGIGMPGLNGIEATRQLRERLPGTQVVILSMHAAPEQVARALKAGARAYVTKDAPVDELAHAVRSVHAGRRYLSEGAAEAIALQVAHGCGDDPLARLSAREREVLQAVAESRTSAEIGRAMHLSPKTVDTYRSRLMRKLGIGDLAGLVRFAIRHGVTTLH